MAKFTVNFKCNARTDERRTEVVEIPDSVPYHGIKIALRAKLLSIGCDFAADIIIASKQVTMHAVECGIPDDVKTSECIDIHA